MMGTSLVEPKAKVRQGFFRRLRLLPLLVVVYLCCIAMARIGPVNTTKLLYADFAAVNSIEPVVHLTSGDSTFVYSVEHETNRSVTLNPKSDSNQNTDGWAPSNRFTSISVFNPAPTSRIITGTVAVRDMACQQSPILNIVGVVEGISMPTSEGGYQILNFVIIIESKQSKEIFLIIDVMCVENRLIKISSLQITW